MLAYCTDKIWEMALSKKIPGLWTKEDTEKAATKTNERLNFSRPLTVFVPLDIRILVDVRVDGTYFRKDQVYQVVMNPNGIVMVGEFGKSGSGTALTFIEDGNLIEGTHFAFL